MSFSILTLDSLPLENTESVDACCDDGLCYYMMLLSTTHVQAGVGGCGRVNSQ